MVVSNLDQEKQRSMVFLLEGTAANLLVGQIRLFPVTGRDPKSKSCNRCDKHDPMMD